MKYQNIFFPEGSIQQIIEVIGEIPNRLLQFGTKNTRKGKPDKFQYNRNIDRLVRFWNAIVINRNLQTYQDDNRLMMWGIQTHEKKKYAFIFEKNSQQNSLSKNHPAWSLKRVGSERTIDFTNINVLDLTKIKRRKYDPTYTFKFGQEFKNIPVNANRIISKLTALNNPNSTCFEYNRLDNNNNMTEKPDLAFSYYGKKRDDCFEQVVFTEADDVNKVYKIQKMMKVIVTKDVEKALSFFSQYAFLLDDKEIEKQLWWVFSNKKPVFKEPIKLIDNEALCGFGRTISNLLAKHYILPKNLQLSGTVKLPPLPSFEIKEKKQEKFDDVFEQELLEICYERKIYESGDATLEKSRIEVDTEEIDNGKYYYAAFTSKKDVKVIADVENVYVAKTIESSIDGLFDKIKCGDDFIRKSSDERLYVIRCCVGNTVKEDVFLNDDGLSDTAGGDRINGAEITKILDQRIIVNK